MCDQDGNKRALPSITTTRRVSVYTVAATIIVTLLFIYYRFEITETQLEGNQNQSVDGELAVLHIEHHHLLTEELSMLNGDDRKKVEKITRDFTIREVEIVIASHNDDLHWTKMYANITTAYIKGTKNNIPSFLPRIISLPNLGREALTYLHHIVKNYHNLADLTVFTHGGAPTRGYMGHRKGGGHMFCETTFHDYLLNPEGYFVFTEVMSVTNAAHAVRQGYNNNDCVRPKSPRNPANSCYCPSESEAILSPGRDHPITVRLMADSCTLDREDACTPTFFWKKYIKLPLPDFNLAWYAQGAVFSVTRADILKRPLSQYRALLKASSLDADPAISFFIEWFWFYLLTSPKKAPCTCGAESMKEFLTFVRRRPAIESAPFPQQAASLRRAANREGLEKAE